MGAGVREVSVLARGGLTLGGVDNHHRSAASGDGGASLRAVGKPAPPCPVRPARSTASINIVGARSPPKPRRRKPPCRSRCSARGIGRARSGPPTRSRGSPTGASSTGVGAAGRVGVTVRRLRLRAAGFGHHVAVTLVPLMFRVTVSATGWPLLSFVSICQHTAVQGSELTGVLLGLGRCPVADLASRQAHTASVGGGAVQDDVQQATGAPVVVARTRIAICPL